MRVPNAWPDPDPAHASRAGGHNITQRTPDPPDCTLQASEQRGRTSRQVQRPTHPRRRRRHSRSTTRPSPKPSATSTPNRPKPPSTWPPSFAPAWTSG